MSSIQTVLGPICSSDLGVTMIHEHVVSRYKENYRPMELNYAVSMLKEARMLGLRTLVEVSPPRMFIDYGGRNIPLLQEVSKKTHVNIICCTGYYQIPPEVKDMTVETIADKMVKEITEGIDGTDVRAGIIKVAANHDPLEPLEEKVFKAAGIAQKRTGVPVQTHCTVGLKTQFEIIVSAGADPRRCAFAHVFTTWGWEGRSAIEQADYLIEFSRRGAYFVNDNPGWEQYTPHEDQVQIMKRFVEKGFADKLFIALDLNYWVRDDGLIEREGDSVNPESRKRDLAYLFTHGIPLFENAGISEDTIHKFMVENPKEYLTPS